MMRCVGSLRRRAVLCFIPTKVDVKEVTLPLGIGIYTNPCAADFMFGCIGQREFAESLRCSLREIPDQNFGYLQRIGESASVSQPKRQS